MCVIGCQRVCVLCERARHLLLQVGDAYVVAAMVPPLTHDQSKRDGQGDTAGTCLKTLRVATLLCSLLIIIYTYRLA